MIIYQISITRSLWLNYESTRDLYGISLSHFVVPPEVFADPNAETAAGRNNRAFCTPSGTIADCAHLHGGVLNISACTASPAVAGIPGVLLRMRCHWLRLPTDVVIGYLL